MTEWLGIVLSVIDLLLVIALFYVGQKAAKIDSMEDALTRKAEQVIDARFMVLSTEFKGATDKLGLVVKIMQQRLNRGDHQFDVQSENQQELELKSAYQITELRKEFASREELKTMGEQVLDVQLKLAKFEEHLKALERRVT